MANAFKYRLNASLFNVRAISLPYYQPCRFRVLDGLKLLCREFDPARWLGAPELVGSGFALAVLEPTGEVLRKARTATYHGLTFTLTPSLATGQRCTLSGSLHRYHNDGQANANRFAMSGIIAAVADLSERFGIDAQMTTLENLEVGVNLPLPFSPACVLDAVVVYHNKPYSLIDTSKPHYGKQWVMDDHTVKLYDKGAQTGNPAANLLRVEVKATKMRFLQRYNVRTLADLTNPAHVGPLVEVLQKAILGMVFLDTRARLDCLTDAERADFYRFRDADTWQPKRADVSRWQRQDYRQRLIRLLEKCNAFNYARALRDGITDEWESLFDDPEKRHKTSPETVASEAHGKATFTPLEYLGVSVAETLSEQGQKGLSIFLPETPPVRVCRSCGKPLTNQKATSVFCSEKYNGATAARTCRNRDSNQRRTKRNQIMRAQQRNQFLQITYAADGSTYTDTLHSSEVGVSRADLDKIVSISILPPCPAADQSGPDCYGHCRCANPEHLTGNDARALLADLTAENAPTQTVPINDH